MQWNKSLKPTVTRVTAFAEKGKARATLRRLSSTVPLIKNRYETIEQLRVIEKKSDNAYLYRKYMNMLTKATVQKSIDRLPSQFSIDELIEQLIFIQKVEDGIQQSKDDNVVSHEDVKSVISKWSK